MAVLRQQSRFTLSSPRVFTGFGIRSPAGPFLGAASASASTVRMASSSNTPTRQHAHPDAIRMALSAAMSHMYRTEVPAYGTLIQLVDEVNRKTLDSDPALAESLAASEELDRISDERHGAIRLGTATELSTMRRLFAVMGMHPVGYYDLSVAGVPVHSTAFRPTSPASLKRNPFRVFTSLLRLDLIGDERLREEVATVLAARQIFTPGCLALIEQAERDGGLSEADASKFVSEALETFRWHSQAAVSLELYQRLRKAHTLIADVVSFKGPHINHLTPRTLDIDSIQMLMPPKGISPKEVVEGPPPRKCPILLRQTSFKALEEPVSFRSSPLDSDTPAAAGSSSSNNGWVAGSHTARFGEIEQRGIALTPKGRALYDQLLNSVRQTIVPKADGSNAAQYMEVLSRVFAAFPDSWDEMRAQGLAYFQWSLTPKGEKEAAAAAASAPTANVAPGAAHASHTASIADLLDRGYVSFHPITYEDFLPVSAAGIFQSNLGDEAKKSVFEGNPSQVRMSGCAYAVLRS